MAEQATLIPKLATNLWLNRPTSLYLNCLMLRRYHGLLLGTLFAHSFTDGTIRLKDGNGKGVNISPDVLYKKARKLPKIVYINACNSAGHLPSSYPETTFIGLGDFTDTLPSSTQALRAAYDLSGPQPVQKFLENLRPNTPTPRIVYPPSPYK